MADRPPKIFVLAESHRQFRQWCSKEHLLHTSSSIMLVLGTDDLRRLQSYAWMGGDRMVIVGSPSYQLSMAFQSEIARMRKVGTRS